jgi:hypothetical protein
LVALPGREKIILAGHNLHVDLPLLVHYFGLTYALVLNGGLFCLR